MKVEQAEGTPSPLSRRSVIGVAAMAAALSLVVRTADARPADARPAGTQPSPGSIKAMTFDVQGTLVDYYQPFTRVSAALGMTKGLCLDWPELLRDWNVAASSIIQAINAGTRPWVPPGQLFHDALDNLLAARGLADRFSDADRLELMSVWGQMAPWPDSAEGIWRLGRKVTVATLSNAGMAAVIALAKRGGLSFDAVLTGELVHAYKPSPDVYRAASMYLGFPPDEIMMVAAHKPDLKAAKAAGFKTAYIPRPFELGPATRVDRSPEAFIDLIADDLIHLSDQIGVA